MQENQEIRVQSVGLEDPWRRKWQPILVFLPGYSMDRGPWQITVHGVAKSWKRLSDWAHTTILLTVFTSVQSLSHVQLFATPWTTACHVPRPSPTPGACSNSRLLSWWCHPTISTSVIPFSSCLQSFPASGSFPMSQLFASGGQNIGVSASASVFLMNIQDWFPWGLTGLISLKSKGLSRVFSNTTVQHHQFFGAQLSLWSNSYIHTWLLEKP